jgi:DNA-binding NtrC family response regulator
MVRGDAVKALIVEPDRDVREILTATLEEMGWSFRETRTVNHATHVLKFEGPFDLYAVATLLPGQHGIVFIEELPMDTRVKVLVLTGVPNEDVLQLTNHMGMNVRQILAKPLTREAVKVKIEELLELGRQD